VVCLWNTELADKNCHRGLQDLEGAYKTLSELGYDVRLANPKKTHDIVSKNKPLLEILKTESN